MYILEILLDESVPDEIKEYYSNLEMIESTDSGIDLPVVEEIKSLPGEVTTLNFKIKCQMINESKENSYSAYYLYPRSSISKTPLMMANSVGIIDRDYRGFIMAKVRNLGQPNSQHIIESGTRLFQICSPDLSPIRAKLVNQLTNTSRGEGGFGSTGVGLN
tara:strand:+ start:1105 stop:1587 length:483 start_codon:yes stop_codon:yes gene_type:complete